MKAQAGGTIPIASPELGLEERQQVSAVLASGMLADGPKVREFEAAFARFCGADYGVATSNGTTALHAALAALGIGDGDLVVTTPFSFVATANAIRLVGAVPVFADIDPETYNLDPNAVEAVAGERDIAAILAVHLYGLPAEMGHLWDVAEDHDAFLVEDAAQAHGATYRGRPVGAIGDVGCFSFYPTKNMTTGEGGMIVTDDERVAETAARFVNHGRSGPYDHAAVGHNFRMTSIGAAIGQAQLDRLPSFVERRRRNAASLDERLRSVAGVQPPVEPGYGRHAYHQYTIRTQDRDDLARHLEAEGIGTGVYYPTCIHEQPAYEAFDDRAPVAERAAREVLSLPVHPNVSEADVGRIADSIRSHVDA